jgi:hypothetical protein
MIPTFRKYFLHKLALNVVLAVVDGLLGPLPMFCSLSFGLENLGVEELRFVEHTVKGLLSDFLGYVVVESDGTTISVGLVVTPDLRPMQTQAQST